MELFAPPGLVRSDEAEIVNCIKAAKQRGDSASWEEADGYLDLTRKGWTQEQIAATCDSTQSHVSKFLACARNYSLGNNRPTFWKAFKEVNNKKQVRETDSSKSQAAGLASCIQCAKTKAKGKKPKKNCQACRNIRAGRAANDNGEDVSDVTLDDDEEIELPDEKPPKKEPTFGESIKRGCAGLKWVGKALRTRDLEPNLFSRAKAALKTIAEMIPALSEAPIRQPYDGKCPKCKAPVKWAVTEKNAWLPLIEGHGYEIKDGIAVAVGREDGVWRNHYQRCSSMKGSEL